MVSSASSSFHACNPPGFPANDVRRLPRSFLPWQGWTLVFAAMLAAAFLIQAWHIARFTPLWKQRSYAFDGDRKHGLDRPSAGCQRETVEPRLWPAAELGERKPRRTLPSSSKWMRTGSRLSTAWSRGYDHRMAYRTGQWLRPVAGLARSHCETRRYAFCSIRKCRVSTCAIDHPDGGAFRLLGRAPGATDRHPRYDRPRCRAFPRRRTGAR